MRTYTSIIVAMAALQGALASPKPETTFLGTLPGDNKPSTTSTTYLGTLPGDNKPLTTSITNLGTLPGDDKPCTTPVATVTTTLLRAICLADRIVCIVPTSACSAGEPTGPTPRPPVTETVAPSGACTATVEVVDNPGCNNCPTCTSAPVVRARQTTTMPGHQECVPTTTVYETTGPQTTEICHCPLIRTACSSGEPTVKPLPTTTLLEGCTESVVVGPGDCSNICPTCS